MRQIYMGSDHQVKPGSFPSQGLLDSDNTGTVLGFRLTHDIDGLSHVRGGTARSAASVAPTSSSVPLQPESTNTAVGFRLSVDWDWP